jgi:hypothetical protein
MRSWVIEVDQFDELRLRPEMSLLGYLLTKWTTLRHGGFPLESGYHETEVGSA